MMYLQPCSGLVFLRFNQLDSRQKLLWILATGLMLRWFFALYSEQIHHADEIFQYLEQAHRLVFGYGVIPWEYRFGIRSWLIPGLAASLLWPLKWLGLDDPALYIPLIKIFFATLSLSLVSSLYRIGQALASERAGLVAAASASFWYELIFFSSKGTPEVLATYAFCAALALAVSPESRQYPSTFGALSALSLILRMHYAPAIGLLLLIGIFMNFRKNIGRVIATFLVIIALAGWLDLLTWGQWFASYYNNFLFNKLYSLNELFGITPFWYYFGSLMACSFGLFAVIGLLATLSPRKTWIPLSLVTLILGSHSLIAHKEHRFIILAIPLFLLLFAILMDQFLRHYRDCPTGRIGSITAGVLFGAISLVGAADLIPFQTIVYPNGLASRQSVLLAIHEARTDPQFMAPLILDTPWSQTGGYYYVHRDIPVYYELHLGDLKPGDYSRHFSHIICPQGYPPLPGYDVFMTIKEIEIRKRTHPTLPLEPPPIDTRNIPQPGIDGVFQPRISRRI